MSKVQSTSQFGFFESRTNFFGVARLSCFHYLIEQNLVVNGSPFRCSQSGGALWRLTKRESVQGLVSDDAAFSGKYCVHYWIITEVISSDSLNLVELVLIHFGGNSLQNVVNFCMLATVSISEILLRSGRCECFVAALTI